MRLLCLESVQQRSALTHLTIPTLRAGATLAYGRLYKRTTGEMMAPRLTEGSDTEAGAGVRLRTPSVSEDTLAYGVLASGLTLTAANPVLSPPEVAHILTLSQPP
jgi:4-coumarate--CoA ligase